MKKSNKEANKLVNQSTQTEKVKMMDAVVMTDIMDEHDDSDDDAPLAVASVRGCRKRPNSFGISPSKPKRQHTIENRKSKAQPTKKASSTFELPPLEIDGVPTPVEKMTQAQLRQFIPTMLKKSLGRGKPGWSNESARPVWWPTELPWANIRIDERTKQDKQKITWTHILQKVVTNCYKHHGREDLLSAFSSEYK